MSGFVRVESDKIASWPMFDWLRLILASAVAFHHDHVIAFPYAGNLAVQVFFALSGWLIGGILLNSQKKDLPRFYFNRATRIWIPYAIAIVLFYGASLLKDPVTASWLEYLFYDLTFTHNWFVPMLQATGVAMPLDGTGNHFWSISTEEQFYLAAPLVILMVKYGRSIGLWAVLCVIAYLSGRYPSICFGVLLAVLRYRFGDWHEEKFARWIVGIATALVGAVILLKTESYAALAPFFSALVVLATAQKGKRGPMGSFVGGISYPLYLNHWIGILAAHEVAQAFGWGTHWTMKVLAYAITFGVSSVLYIMVDQQIQRRRGAYFSQGLGKSMAIAAYGLVIVGAIGGFVLRF